MGLEPGAEIRIEELVVLALPPFSLRISTVPSNYWE
jgi:hypothetical protein